MTDELPKLKIEHIERPRLPWRDQPFTECGLPCEGHPVVTRDEAKQRFRELGQQRASFTLCVTCIQTVGRWPTWDTDPVQCMARETANWNRHAPTLRNELLAIAKLIEAHRDEFDELMAGLADVVDLRAARQQQLRMRQPRGPFGGAS